VHLWHPAEVHSINVLNNIITTDSNRLYINSGRTFSISGKFSTVLKVLHSSKFFGSSDIKRSQQQKWEVEITVTVSNSQPNRNCLTCQWEN